MNKQLTPCTNCKYELGAMSLSDRDANEVSPKKKVKWCTQH